MPRTNIDLVMQNRIGVINPNLYGHFVEHLGGVVYDGIWVGEDSPIPNIHGFRKELVEKLRAIRPPVIRWPGGCFAETYDWRDGIGPREERPTTVNWWYNNDGLYESNAVGTHEFVEFCRLVGAEPYFALNATTTTPLEGRNWVEYCNMPKGSTSLAKLREKNGSPEPFNVRYWGLGNENWGGGGAMTPEDYCSVYRKYGIVVKSVYPQGYFIACGANDDIPEWTLKFFERYKQQYNQSRIPPMDGYSLHYYVSNTGDLGLATEYTDEQWYETLRRAWGIEPFIERQIEMLGAAVPGNDLGLVVDEWGLWQMYEGKQAIPGRHLFSQETTMRDALVAAITLNVFNNHCDRVRMANVAQLVNCIQSLFLARGEKFMVTGTYHIFDMFKGHQCASAIQTLVDTDSVFYGFAGEKQAVDAVSCSASVKDGMLRVSLANLMIDREQEITVNLSQGCFAGEGSLTLLAGVDDKDSNTFEEPDRVAPRSVKLAADGRTLTVTLPKASVGVVSVPVKE